MGFIRNAKERKIARELDTKALIAAVPDPEAEITTGRPDPNATHGRNTRRELKSEARHLRADV